ncbi:NAD(P)H-binding protein [Saccharibacillus alkalitolerans]|uniref:SDR family oxidoreductase n=1 Tax=Saccharibacillus alkalitolerans TaxID=2705290 RepID=A0ABX0FB70_9BACL|nr:NAD(P)-binding oxidoreductase [Saccharibacillus alkalitolerans]NGZ75267.1 SDR family oxidoreductase [Saccharibacillus alkalitolerans]
MPQSDERTGGWTNLRAGLKVTAANFAPGTIMSEGLANILAASRRAGVKRLIMQSGINLSDGTELAFCHRGMVRGMRRMFRTAIEDKSAAEQAVMASGLDWIIVRASVLKYADATLNYTAGPRARIAPLRPIPYADCADCLIRAAAGEPGWSGRIVNVGK